MIKIREMGYSYKEKNIFKDLDLTVEEGKPFIIIGNIGAGKTTLFRILTGFYTEFTGTIKYDGINIDHFDIPLNIAFVEQNTDYQLLTLSVKSELELFSNNSINNSMIKYFELNELLERNPQTLSSSEKRRVLLAGVFSSKTKYIFMDEPTADLDDHFTKILLELVEKDERTIVIFTHDKKLRENGKFRTFKI
ncbi:ABC transporter ATP-binding protein [bacterium]|nr:ABC transporter ATP-binding protein [bacterium]